MIPTSAGTTASRENSFRRQHLQDMVAVSRASSAAGREGAPSSSLGSINHVRIRAYRFGDHIPSGSKRDRPARGYLCMLPVPQNSHLNNSRVVFETQKKNLVRITYGEQVDFQRLQYDNVQLFLFPEGEEITDSSK